MAIKFLKIGATWDYPVHADNNKIVFTFIQLVLFKNKLRNIQIRSYNIYCTMIDVIVHLSHTAQK